MMGKEEFLIEFASLLAREPGGLTGDEALDELEGWDSLAVVSFMGFADERFGITLSAKEIESYVKINDLFDMVTKKVPVS
jgi:acyl carrier protein